MKQYKKDFIELLVEAEALKFGEFTLKSGRIAPYFLNAGSFYTGEFVTRLGKAYAEAFLDSGLEVDVIFGPAYKGIPLSVVTTSILYSQFQKNISYCFNRKTAKEYGQKDNLIGAPLSGDKKVLLIDDVITAGTAIRESMEILRENGNSEVLGVLISLDRMEKNNEGVNALKAIEEDFGIKVVSIVNLDDVIDALYGNDVGGKVYIDDDMMEKIKKYRAEYGI
ncbi:MAG: orotate phosphoribosyltransferase [Candidatus Peregrinibacteria bacterium]